MDPFDLTLHFVEHCDRATRTTELSGAFQRNLETLGFRYFACASHVDPLRAGQEIMVLNYPQAWVEHYSEQQLHLVDPVFRRADRTRRPFFWDEPEFRAAMSPKQRKMQALARNFGIAHGYTIPLHGPLHTSLCSVVPDSPKLSQRHYVAVELMASHLFDRIARLRYPDETPESMPHLSRREKQCLELAACGKSDAEIAVLLGLCKATVHNYIESAKRRLAMCTRMQAVVYALGTRQIRLEELLRPLHRAVRHRRA